MQSVTVPHASGSADHTFTLSSPGRKRLDVTLSHSTTWPIRLEYTHIPTLILFHWLLRLNSTFWVGCPAQTLQAVIVKGYRLMPGDVILVGKFVQMVVTSYRLQHPVWTTDPKSTVYDCLVHINYINININSLLYW